MGDVTQDSSDGTKRQAPSGTLPTRPPADGPVAIEFHSDGLTLDINGVVAWCREHRPSDEEGADESFVLGIELFSPMLLLSAFRDALPKDAETFEDL